MRAKRPAAPKYKRRTFCTAPPRPAGTGKVSASGTAAGGLPPANRAQGPPPEPLTAPPGFLALPSFRPGGRLEGGGPCPPLFAPPAFFGYMIKAEQPAAAPALPPSQAPGRLPFGRMAKNRPGTCQGAQGGRGGGLPSLSFPFLPRLRLWRGRKRAGEKATGDRLGPDIVKRLWMVRARAQPPAAPHSQKGIRGAAVVRIEHVFGWSQDGASCNGWHVPRPQAVSFAGSCGYLRSTQGRPILGCLSQAYAAPIPSQSQLGIV